MNCTWKDCKKEASEKQLDKNGDMWANLCKEHYDEIENAIKTEPFDPKKMLRIWVLASGGAKKMAGKISS